MISTNTVPFSVKRPDIYVLLQQNHEALMSLYKDLETGTYVPNAASSSWKDRKKEEKELIDSLLTQFSKRRQCYSKTTVRQLGEHFILCIYK